MKIVKIEKITNNSHLYDIQTKTQNFFANKILVHNSIIKVWHDNGRWNISTNGTINAYNTDLFSPCDEFSTYADMFNHCAYIQKLSFDVLNKDYTYIFEIISPFNRVVVPYKETMIYHIGTRDNISLQELDEDIGIDKPKEYSFNTIEECIEAARNLPFSEEGYVAVDKNFKRNKIKSLEYVKAHALRQNGAITNKNVLEMLLTDDGGKEFLSIFPEYIPFFDKVSFAYNSFLNANKQMGEVMLSQKFENRKEMALWIMAVCKDRTYYSPFFFQLADRKVNDIIDFVKKMTVDKLNEVIFGG